MLDKVGVLFHSGDPRWIKELNQMKIKLHVLTILLEIECGLVLGLVKCIIMLNEL